IGNSPLMRLVSNYASSIQLRRKTSQTTFEPPLSAVLGAQLIGSSPLIAVDVDSRALDRATDLGATHTINTGSTDPVDRLRELTDGGPDYALACTGADTAHQQALAATRKGGTVVIVGGADETLGLDPRRDLVPGGKTIVDSIVGSLRPHTDIPRYAMLCADGKLELDELITHQCGLSGIQAAFDRMARGEGIRTVVKPGL
ncbi:zinc-binding dehydrogenase, partial [Halorubrum vacuolatum]